MVDDIGPTVNQATGKGDVGTKHTRRITWESTVRANKVHLDMSTMAKGSTDDQK